jgi:hypothetical protein
MHDIQITILGACLLLMGLVNIYSLLKLLPHIDAEDKHIGDLTKVNTVTQLAVGQILTAVEALPAKLLANLPAGPQPSTDLPEAVSGEATLEEVADADLSAIKSGLAESHAVLGALAGMSREEFEAWRDANALRIQTLMATQEIQQRDLEKTQLALDHAKATLLMQKSRPVDTTSPDPVSAMPEVPIASEIYNEITRLTTENIELATALDTAQKENVFFAHQLRSLEGLHARTLQEKNFVEDALVQMDQHIEDIKQIPVAVTV